MASPDTRLQAGPGLGLQLEAARPSGSSSSTIFSNVLMNETPSRNLSISPHSKTTQGSASKAQDGEAHRAVRTLPSWIDSFENGDELLNPLKSPDTLLPTPPRAYPPNHQHTPASPARRVSQDGYVDTWDDGEYEKKPETGFFGGFKEPVKGRKWDHAREGDPVIMRSTAVMTSSPWRTFVKASRYGHAPAEDTKRVDEDFLKGQTPGYERPWRGDMEGGEDSENLSSLFHHRKKRQTLSRRIQHTMLMDPYIPLIFRVVVFITSVIALGISCSVHRLAHKYNYPQTPSTVMAIIVDVIAIPYTLYITWDEYTGKPLGLRSPKAKMRLLILDLFFIIFEAANLALAFISLTDDNGSCQIGVNGFNGSLCHRVETLCGFLMLALNAWTLTFMVSLFRLVERVGGREEED